MKDDSVYLHHIMECIRRVEENVSGGHEKFIRSHTLQDAVLRNLQTMAEATERLRAALKASYSEIEWSRVAAFRNVLVHNYLGIDREAVWEITQRDIPQLKGVVAVILKENQ